jgi:hypothetical protein
VKPGFGKTALVAIQSEEPFPIKTIDKFFEPKRAQRMMFVDFFFGSVKARSAISTVVLKSLWKRTVRAS